MGDRASYALRRPGSRKIDVRLAPFGSPFLFGDVFWGPQHTEAMIESLERGPWLDDLYGEAAVALCLKTKRVAIYTYQLSPEDAVVAARLMAPLWPGWEIRFTTRLTEVAPTVGLDLVKQWVREARRGAARRLAYYRQRDPLPELGQRFAASWFDLPFHGLISMVGDTTIDYLADVELDRLLFVGPPLLEALPRLPTLAVAEPTLWVGRRAWDRGSPADLFVSFRPGPHAIIDAKARRLVLTVEPGLQQTEHYASAHAFEIAWPGWSLTVQIGGVAAHFGVTERDVPAVFVAPPTSAAAADEPPDVVASLRLIRDLVLGADKEKEEAGAFLERAAVVTEGLVADLGASGGALLAASPGAMSTPPSVLTPHEKQQLWELAVREAGLVAEAARAEEPAANGPGSPDPDALFREAHMAHKYGTDREETWRRVEALLAVAPAHPKGLGLAGRLSFIGERLDDARRYAEAALALEPEDAESWGTLALVAGSRGDYDEQVRCYRRAIAAAPYPWIVNNLTCIYLNRAEHEPDAALRQRLLEEALAVNTSCRQRTSNLHWGEACALSMLGIEADRAHEAAANAVTTYQGSRGELRQKLNADPQLAWLWTQKGPLTA